MSDNKTVKGTLRIASFGSVEDVNGFLKTVSEWQVVSMHVNLSDSHECGLWWECTILYRLRNEVE